MKKFAVMVTDISDDSDFEAKLIALVDSQFQAINVAENHLQSIIKSYAKIGIKIEADDCFRAADENGRYAWQLSIQEIELDIGLIK